MYQSSNMYWRTEIVLFFFGCIINMALLQRCPQLYSIAQFIRFVTMNSFLVKCLNVYYCLGVLSS